MRVSAARVFAVAVLAGLAPAAAGAASFGVSASVVSSVRVGAGAALPAVPAGSVQISVRDGQSERLFSDVRAADAALAQLAARGSADAEVTLLF